MEVTNEILWLIAGVILVFLEFTLLPAVGMLFAGIAALLVGVLLEAGIITNLEEQWVVFLAATTVLSVAFYNSLKNFRSGKNAEYKDMVGEEVITEEALEIGKTGKVKWSGTIMKARLCPDCKTGLPSGVTARIIGLDGNILIIK